MADFLPEPDLRFLRPEQGVRDTAIASAAESAASAIGTLGQRAKQVKAEKLEIERGEAVGEATTSLLELEDERSSLLLQEQELSRVSAGIHADGQVTAEEQATLAGLENDFTKLKQARSTGLLNPTAFATRRNALHRQALADVSNLAIQREINSLFTSGVTSLEAPQSPAEAQLNTNLDQMYGVGAWGASEKGKLVGQQMFVAQKQAEGQATLTALDGQVANISTAFSDTAVKSFLTNIRVKGFASDQVRENYRLAAITAFSSAEKQLNDTIRQARANGQIIDQTLVRQLREDLAADRQFYTSDIFEQDLSDTDFLSKVETAVEIRNKMFEARLNVRSANLVSASLGGIAGGSGQNYILPIAQMAPEQLASLLPEGADVHGVLNNAKIAATQWATVQEFSYADQVDEGLLHRNIATLLSGTAMNQLDTDTPEGYKAWSKGVQDYRVSAGISDQGQFTESINNFTGMVNKAAVAAQKNGNARVKGDVNQVLRAHLRRVEDDIKNSAGAIEIVRVDGLPSVRITRNDIAGQGTLHSIKVSPSLEALVKEYQAYSNVGLADMKDLEVLISDVDVQKGEEDGGE